MRVRGLCSQDTNIENPGKGFTEDLREALQVCRGLGRLSHGGLAVDGFGLLDKRLGCGCVRPWKGLVFFTSHSTYSACTSL